MDDRDIIQLYFDRSEAAIAASDRKYGPYCRTVAGNILPSSQDVEECVNDTWLRAWNAMPPQRPQRLKTFLGKITRNLALHRWEVLHAAKRGGGQVDLALEELEGCLPGAGDTEAQIIERAVLTQVLNGFVASLSRQGRILFLRRYWYLQPIEQIAREMGISKSKVKMTLSRQRDKLRRRLEEEGCAL